MIVSELRAVLDHLPGDLPVLLSTPGTGAFHVDEAHRTQAWRHRGPGLVLRADMRNPTLHLDPDPGFTLAGHYRRPDELLLRLDPDVPLGAPVPSRP